jgi:farnesyl-diphosphate farnesyltransferase
MVDKNYISSTILKGVSRSFYLSLRLLPPAMQEGASLGYLLARMSDTIADTVSVSCEDRINLLDLFHQAIKDGDQFVTSHDLLEKYEPREKILLENSREIFSWLHSYDHADLILNLLDEIISGQRLDLVKFDQPEKDRLASFASDHELIDYCERVAGSVGEFWTRLGFLTMKEKFSISDQAAMITLGRKFGVGLQLVNILRDMPVDLKNGRSYLGELALADDEQLMKIHASWLIKTQSFVECGFAYADKVSDRRVRAASVLPAIIAKKTLAKMENISFVALKQRVKINRYDVLCSVVKSSVY